MAGADQGFGEVRTDEALAASNHYIHNESKNQKLGDR